MTRITIEIFGQNNEWMDTVTVEPSDLLILRELGEGVFEARSIGQEIKGETNETPPLPEPVPVEPRTWWGFS